MYKLWLVYKKGKKVKEKKESEFDSSFQVMEANDVNKYIGIDINKVHNQQY
jgi:hypothetical protein